tara:strand:- start:106 stop:345 length:240 start_codon:yes stop_codon:yes gene_type:complete
VVAQPDTAIDFVEVAADFVEVAAVSAVSAVSAVDVASFVEEMGMPLVMAHRAVSVDVGLAVGLAAAVHSHCVFFGCDAV